MTACPSFSRCFRSTVLVSAMALLFFGGALPTFVAPSPHLETARHTPVQQTGQGSFSRHASAGFASGVICPTLAAVSLVAVGLKSRQTRVARQARGGESTYWEGEWICADCGYIYNERVFSGKFEDQQRGFKCPACAAPRRRFARKLGDKVGTTLDGGDAPILVFSLLALFAVFAIAYVSIM